jgi:hypothetical protein
MILRVLGWTYFFLAKKIKTHQHMKPHRMLWRATLKATIQGVNGYRNIPDEGLPLK